MSDTHETGRAGNGAGEAPALDRRLHAFRADLADRRLAGQVPAARFVDGRPGHVTAAVADVKPAPDLRMATDTQVLRGEGVRIFERAAGWAWIQAETDGYVGYVKDAQIAEGAEAATHRIVVPRSFLYPRADLKHPPLAALSAGTLLAVREEAETRGTRYCVLADGAAVVAGHCLPVGAPASDDYVAHAGLFLETPYLWGGRSGFGLDCSGLVQMALLLAGRPAPRDSDMQAGGLGAVVEEEARPGRLRRGDLVFWKGHVGIMEDPATLLHASGAAMRVVREPLADAVARIAALYGAPTVVRRPAGSHGWTPRSG